ncbi:MAG: hypothetical protein HQM00_17365, partial [Magnetococcales bacterium]|nr:hypothetical protein [Magnetococcales bacterium]
MFRFLVMVGVLGVTLTSLDSLHAAAVGGDAGYDPRGICERFAQEDGVRSEKMNAYMDQCLRDLAMDRAYEEEEPIDSEPSEETTGGGSPAQVKPPVKAAPSAQVKPPVKAAPSAQAQPPVKAA